MKPSSTWEGVVLSALYLGVHFVFLPFDLFLLFMGAVFVATLIHESAHLVVAWWGNFKIQEISVGVGPPLLRLTISVPRWDFPSYRFRARHNTRDIHITFTGLLLGGFVSFYRHEDELSGRYRAFRPRDIPHNELILVSLAGPVSNIIVALVSLLLATALTSGGISFLDAIWKVTEDYMRIIVAGDWSGYFETALFVGKEGATPYTIAIYFAFFNVGMAIFNLIPFPIADGGWVVRHSVDKALGEEPYWLVGAMWGCTVAWLIGVHASAVYWVFG